MEISYYKSNYKSKNETSSGGNVDIEALKEEVIAKESNPNSESEWWDDFKHLMGFNRNTTPLPQEINSEFRARMITAKGGGRWASGSKVTSTSGEESESPFVDGGHVFEGWDESGTWRYTVLIGKFKAGRAHVFTFKPNENGVEEFGIVTVGGDHEYDGMDFAQKYAQMWGNIVAASFSGSSNYGSQKYYGGISGTDKTKPSGAHLEITADFHSTAPKQARFNNCDNGVVIPVLESDPTVLNDGTMWYNSIEQKFKMIIGGEIKSFVME